MNSNYGYWGDASDGAATTAADAGAPMPGGISEATYLATLQTASPLLQSLAASLSDPVRRAALLRAELQNAAARGAPVATLLVIRAKLDAAERAAATRVTSEQSTQEYRTLGKVAAASGIVVAGSLAFYLIVKALS